MVRRMHVLAGGIEAFGDYSYLPGETRPNRFSLTVPSAELGEVERIMLPALQRSSGFLARTLRLKSAAPAWLMECLWEIAQARLLQYPGPWKLREMDLCQTVRPSTDLQPCRWAVLLSLRR